MKSILFESVNLSFLTFQTRFGLRFRKIMLRFFVTFERLRMFSVRKIFSGPGNEYSRLYAQCRRSQSSSFHEFTNVKILLFTGQLRNHRLISRRYKGKNRFLFPN